MMHQSFLIRNINRVHLHIRVVLSSQRILEHIVGGSDKELLLLLIVHFSWVAAPGVLLLLLDLHVPVLIFAMLKRVV